MNTKPTYDDGSMPVRDFILACGLAVVMMLIVGLMLHWHDGWRQGHQDHKEVTATILN